MYRCNPSHEPQKLNRHLTSLVVHHKMMRPSSARLHTSSISVLLSMRFFPRESELGKQNTNKTKKPALLHARFAAITITQTTV